MLQSKQKIAADFPRFELAAFEHRNNVGQPLSFDNRLWLSHIYCDHADTIIICKASQVGITEFAICDMMALARLGVAGMYVLPTDVWKNTFVANRINRSILETPLYRGHTAKIKRDSDSLSLKTFFGVNWKFVGSQQRNNFYEFPAGSMLIDEYDLCDVENIAYAQDRLAAAERPRVRKFGNPTIAGFGIDYEYNRSDKKTWQVKCPHCNKYQILDWFEHFVRENANGWELSPLSSKDSPGTLLCRGCNKSFHRLSPGQWVAEHPGRDISGYHVSRLFGDVRPTAIRKLFSEWIEAQASTTLMQRFYNNVLGIPYRAEGAAFTPELLLRAKADYNIPTSAENTVAGLDVGSVFNLWISKVEDGIYKTLYAGAMKRIEDVSIACAQYGVTTGVIDAQPESRLSETFCRDHPGWYRCFYSVSDEAKDLQQVDHVRRIVKTNRTAACDAFYGRFCTGRYQLPQTYSSIKDFAPQLLAPTRVSKTTNGKERMIWDEGSQADHYFHAGVYCNIAGDLSVAAQNMLVVL